MAKSYEISQSQLLEIEAARKKNRNKNVERRLCVLVMRAEGKSLEEISEKTGYHISTASKLIARYMRDGISAIAENHYKGNRRNMSFEEEAAILAPFIERAERGEMVDIKEIAAAYQKAVPHKVSDTQIYYVLHRHGWRKIMPRSRHPKKASEEAIEASKKLKQP
mgnify:FL=1